MDGTLRPVGQLCIDYTLSTTFLTSTLHCYRCFEVFLIPSSKMVQYVKLRCSRFLIHLF